jgi:hypothetical protein
MTAAPGTSASGRRARLVWLIPLSLLGLLFLTFRFQPDWPTASRGVNDFMGMYAHARLVGSPDQYRSERYAEAQVAETGYLAPAAQGNRLPIFAYTLRPLAKLPYFTAYKLWQVVSLGAFVGFLILWPEPERNLLLLAACWSFPLFANFANAQDVTFLLLFLAAALRVHGSRPGASGQWLSGGILALCALKFHLFLLVPVLLIAQRKWRMLAGGSVVLLALYLGSSVVSAPNWAQEFIRSSLGGDVNPEVLKMPNLRGLLEGLPHAWVWELAGAACVTAAVLWLAPRNSFPLALSATLVGGLLVGHHAYSSDALLLLPALVTIARAIPSPAVRLFAGLLLSPLPFLVVPLIPLAAPVTFLMICVLIALVVVERNRGFDGRAIVTAGG